MENPDKLRKNKVTRLGMAGIALLGTIATEQSADAAPQKIPDAQSQSFPIKNTAQSPVERLNWFTKGLNTLGTLPAGEVRKFEKAIEKGDIPLSLQINFLEQSLKAGGQQYRELMDPRLSEERFSQIVKLADTVSARLTLAYQAKNADPEIQKYFDIKNVAAATRPLNLKEGYCNGFLARAREDVYYAVAAHCVRGTTVEQQFTLGAGGADTAVKYIPQQQWSVWRIQNAAELPNISEATTTESASGSVVVSYSWSPKDEKGLQQQKVHFSFAMPFSATARAHAGGQDVDTQYPYMKNTVMFLKPHDEGEFVRKNPDGTYLTRSGGSSGSLVAAFKDGRYEVLGNFVGNKVLQDSCQKLCYAISYGATPEALKNTIRAERDKRLQQSVVVHSPQKGGRPSSVNLFNPRRLIDQ